MDGILIIDKPAGITSHDVVARCRRILKTKSIGHTGTLDPFATGVMVLLIGKATRLARFLDKDAKEYEALVRFGYETDTGDLTGSAKCKVQSAKSVLPEDVERVLPEFRGEIMQTPPMYSAKKIAGKKLYELARQGIEVERQGVNVNIYELEMGESGKWKVKSGKLKAESEKSGEGISDEEISDVKISDISIRVVCSAGTYIRVLAEEIGRKIGVGAHLAALRRTRAGKFVLSRGVTLEELEKLTAENRVSEILVSMNEAVSHLPERKVSADEIGKIKNGVKIPVDNESFAVGAIVRLTNETNDLIAVGFYDTDENFIQPKLVLV